MYDFAYLSVRCSVRDSTDPGTIAMVQGFGFSMKIRGFTVGVNHMDTFMFYVPFYVILSARPPLLC
jgi:hypothetical protein